MSPPNEGLPAGNREARGNQAMVPTIIQGTTDTISALDEIAALRRAARSVVHRPDLSTRERHSAIIELGFRARAAAFPFSATRAVWEEVRTDLGELPPSPTDGLPGEPVERAIRGLTARGLIRCPSCLRELPGEGTLARWRDLRRMAVDESRRREVASHA